MEEEKMLPIRRVQELERKQINLAGLPAMRIERKFLFGDGKMIPYRMMRKVHIVQVIPDGYVCTLAFF